MPSPSPTTTRAVKLKRRPPFTTLATRLMATTRSTYAVLSAPPRGSSRPPRRSPPRSLPERCPRWAPLMSVSSSRSLGEGRGVPTDPQGESERQPALAGAVGEGRDAAVVLVAGAVEDHAVDTGGLGTLGDDFADLAGLRRLVTLERAQVCLHARGGRDGPADQVVDDLDGDVLGRPGDDQARALGGAVELLAAAHLTAQPRLGARCGVLAVGQGDRHGHLPAFPTFLRT